MGELTTRGHSGAFWGDEILCNLTMMVIIQLIYLSKLNKLNFPLKKDELYFNYISMKKMLPESSVKCFIFI